jgi:hypothetical protein
LACYEIVDHGVEVGGGSYDGAMTGVVRRVSFLTP